MAGPPLAGIPVRELRDYPFCSRLRSRPFFNWALTTTGRATIMLAAIISLRLTDRAKQRLKHHKPEKIKTNLVVHLCYLPSLVTGSSAVLASRPMSLPSWLAPGRDSAAQHGDRGSCSGAVWFLADPGDRRERITSELPGDLRPDK